MIVYSKSSGLNPGAYGRLETPIKMVIEHESDIQTKKGGICSWLFNVERSNKFGETIIGQSEFDVFNAALEGAGADNDTITSLATMGDAAIGTTVGDAWTTYLENYNIENNNALNISYYSEDIAVIIQDIANGRVAATLNDPVVMWQKVEAQNLQDSVKLVGSLEGSGCCYTAFQMTPEGEALRDAFDAVYLEMINDGTIAQLSVKWFGNDYTGNLLANVVTE